MGGMAELSHDRLFQAVACYMEKIRAFDVRRSGLIAEIVGDAHERIDRAHREPLG